jgi:diguanylate cyclase (GGDEF)-like protein
MAILESLDREVSRSNREKKSLAVIMADLDHFKEINDTYGHEAGDGVISRIARILTEGTRGIDLAARIGGDEFGIILTETQSQSAAEVAERLRLAIRATEIPGIGKVTGSFGIAECPSCAENSRELLSCADAALYKAKREGRDRVAHADITKSNSVAVGDVQ